jgi:hypothetical protein
MSLKPFLSQINAGLRSPISKAIIGPIKEEKENTK